MGSRDSENDDAFEADDDERPRKRRRRRDEEDEDDRPRSVRKNGNLDRASLWSVAMYQKGILACILVYVILVIAGIFVPAELKWIVALAGLPVLIGATVFVFLLATKVYTPVVGVLLGLLTLIPCVGLIVLLVINGQATSILKSHGIHVGLLGASLSDLS